MNESPYCAVCKRFYHDKKRGDKAPRHKPILDNSGELGPDWCEGGGQEFEVRAWPEVPPESCLVCDKEIPFGPDCLVVKPARVYQGSHGRSNMFATPHGTRPLGGIHKTCLSQQEGG